MKSDVLIINPPYIFNRQGEYSSDKNVWKPLGILSLAAVLKKEGILVEVIDLVPLEKSLAWIVDHVEKIEPSVVGITGTTAQVRGIVQLGETLKKKFGEKIKLIVGGSHISADKDFLREFPFFDVGFVGEGEITFPEIVKKIIKGRSVDRIVVGKPPANLDNLPFPERNLLDDEDYLGPYGKRFATIHTTRGCPFHCLYCSSPVEKLAKVRFRSPGSVVEEIEKCIKGSNTNYFIFTDDTFTLDHARVEKICREILKRKIKVKFNCETRANLVDKPLLSLMRKAGCDEIFFGVESGSERIRNKIIHKNISDNDLYHAFAVCQDLGIITNAFLMAGFPTETKEDLKKTKDFCFKAEPDIIGIHLTTILPGSPIFELAVREGKIKPNIWHDYAKGIVKKQPIYVSAGLSLKDLDDFQKNLYRQFYFRPSWLLRRLKISFSSSARFKADLGIALRILLKGKLKSRSYQEEDYF